MKKEVIEKFAVLVTGAFAFVSALAWNSAIQTTFEEIFPSRTGLTAMFSYAILVTLVAVFTTLWISKISDKARK